MSITVSPEAEAKARQIPDFSARLERFIGEQFALEQWRARRTNVDVAAIVEEGLRERESLRASGVEREVLFARLLSLITGPGHGE